MRTFEHDIYVETKNVLTLKNKNFVNKRLSLNNTTERRILKLIENHNNNDHIYETLPSVRSKDYNNPYGILLRKNLESFEDTSVSQENNLSSRSSKLALSEPNLSIIGRNDTKSPNVKVL